MPMPRPNLILEKKEKKKGFLGFGGVTSDALDLHFKKEEQKKNA